MKRCKLSAFDYANAIDKLNTEYKEVVYLLTVYKDALSGACYELSNLLDNHNPKIDDNYWLIEAIKNIESKKPQTPTA